MRFVLTFKTGAPVEFDIPEAALKRHPETIAFSRDGGQL